MVVTDAIFSGATEHWKKKVVLSYELFFEPVCQTSQIKPLQNFDFEEMNQFDEKNLTILRQD